MSSDTREARELRRHPRMLKDARVEYRELFYPLEDREVTVTRMKNISGGGLLLQMDQPCELGTCLELEIDLRGWARRRPGFFRNVTADLDRKITVLAEVVWTEPMGDAPEGGTEGGIEGHNVGVKFINIYEDDLEGLIGMIDSKGSQGEEGSKG